MVCNILAMGYLWHNIPGKGPGFALHFKELLGDGIFSSGNSPVSALKG